MIIAIDGTSGSGKGAIASQLAKILDYNYLNTGLLYRKIAYLLKKNGLVYSSNIAITHFLKNIVIANEKIDENILQSEEIGQLTSIIATNGYIRSIMTDIQRNLVIKNNKIIPTIVDGRDAGSVVFKDDATHKFFISTYLHTRAIRRFKQFNCKISYQRIYNSLLKRDIRDKNRKIAPLVLTKNTIVINNNRTLDFTINNILFIING